MRPQFDKLIVPRLALAFGDIPLDPSEAQSRIAMSGLPSSFFGSYTAMQMFALSARTAILYLIDPDSWLGALGSAGESPLGELPPLPFPRIAVESPGDDTFLIGSEADPHMYLEALTLTQMTGGWGVVLYGHTIGSHEVKMREMRLHMFEITWQGKVRVARHGKDGQTEMADVEDERTARIYKKFCVETVHLITAQGVQLIGQTPDRAERRRFKRATGGAYPQMYYVTITGDTIVRGGGGMDRRYTCRWMVRGHWRHFENGDRTWVRAFIKGPAGAPWRGRPIYVVESAA